MEQNAQHVLGGDIVIGSSRPFDQEIFKQAQNEQLTIAETLNFTSVVSTQDGFLLVSVKSVSDNYPLKGSLRAATELYGEESILSAGPAPGEVWAEPRVFHHLQINTGDSLELGATQLKLSRALMYEPDRGNNFYSFTPRVMMNQADLEAAQIIQPGSRVWYRIALSGNIQNVESFTNWLRPRLEPGQRIFDLSEDRPEVSRSLGKAKQYMGLASLIALLLATVAIASSGRRYTERHFNNSALLRCLGCRQNDVLQIYLLQLTVLAVVAGIVGSLVGWLAQQGLIASVSNLLPDKLPETRLRISLMAIGLSVVVLLGTTLPALLRLKNVSPLRVLRKDLEPASTKIWLTWLFTLLAVGTLMWVYTDSLKLTLSILLGTLVVLGISGIFLHYLFRLFIYSLRFLPGYLKLGVRNFLRRRNDALVQTMALSLIVMTMLVILLLRIELLSNWQRTIPQDTPNHFVLNLQDQDRDQYLAFLEQQQFETQPLYPVVRGRLMRINDNPVKEHVSKEQENHNSLRRELNLTWAQDIPKDNEILAGDWWSDSDPNNAVSIESELAEELNVEIGDTLTFFTGDRQWDAVVSSIRSVKWDNFSPNFYMIFKPGALDELPVTWINSFFIPPEKKKVLVDLIKNFPSITLLEMDAILNQVRKILSQVVFAIEMILIFVLAAGLTVTLASIQTSMTERIREGIIMRSMGARNALLRRNQVVEFATLGLLSGLLAVIGAELISANIQQRIFELEYTPALWSWIVVPIVTSIIVLVTGLLASRGVTKHSPVDSLRKI